MTPFVSSWKTNLLLSSRTPLFFWALALLLTLILHMLLIWQFRGWLAQRPPKPEFLSVEWLAPPEIPSPQKVSVKEPIPAPPKNEEPELLNDLIQKEPSEKLSMKMLKTAKKNRDAEKSKVSQGLPSEPAGIKKEPKSQAKPEDVPLMSPPNSILSETEERQASSEENELKYYLAFLPPQSLDGEFDEVVPKNLKAGKMKPLPENWMLRKTVPKSEEETKSPGLRSLIQNAWFSEIDSA